jgi:RNA polymerase sigma factor (sigma-70 family)
MSIPEPAVPDDQTLVARCREGDASAWAVLVRRYQRLVHAIVLRAGLDQQAAADVFQTVFLRLLQHLPGIAEPARLQAWIVTTTKREAWLLRRRGERMVSMTGAEPDGADDEYWAIADTALGPEDTVAHWQQLAQVQRGLDRLDDRCRQLLQALFGSENIGYDDVVRRLGMPIGSIGPTRARCLARLRRLID